MAACRLLLWQRAREPFLGAWSLPGGYLEPGETLEQSIRQPPRRKGRRARARTPRTARDAQRPRPQPAASGSSRPRTSASCRPVSTRSSPRTRRWHPVSALPELAFDHREITLAGRERLRAKLSYTNIGFALAPAEFTISELRDLYAAALGHDVSATNLQRVLLRRGVLEATGERREPGRGGGRPAAVFRFRSRRLEITDQFAVLRPPG